MKLTVLGGGGYRAPLLMKSVALRANELGINSVWLMDINKEKLNRYGALAKTVSERIAPRLSVELTDEPEAALKDADYIITTIRADGDEGRVFDERHALSCGVLGQETTGAGGFAMSLRSINEIARYCELVEKVAKSGAPVFNFTNPSGLVTEAMRRKGYKNVYGVCDAPSCLMRQVGAMLGTEKVEAQCYGLNHLSFFKDFRCNGKDITERVLKHPRLTLDTDMRLFGEGLLSLLYGTLPNEYLYFYFFRDKAVQSILQNGETRGETILKINREMDKDLSRIDVSEQTDEAFTRFRRYYFMRENSYFSIESGVSRPPLEEKFSLDAFVSEPDEGGYAGVALDFIAARETGRQVRMVLSVPNEGAVPGLEPEDVVETSCIIDENGCRPEPIDWIPREQFALIYNVKAYERLTVEAVFEKSRSKAVRALMIHPLVGSYSTAVKLVDGYLEKYKAYAGEWN